jgi:hypothetical protein
VPNLSILDSREVLTRLPVIPHLPGRRKTACSGHPDNEAQNQWQPLEIVLNKKVIKVCLGIKIRKKVLVTSRVETLDSIQKGKCIGIFLE